MRKPKSTIVPIKKHLTFYNSHFSLQEGYTFVELLVVISIIGLFSMISIASFVGYNDKQVLDANAKNVKNVYLLARSKAASQVKPPVCGTDTLNGYQVLLKVNNVYELDVVCGNNPYLISSKSLPQNISFDPTSTNKVLFKVTTANIGSAATISISRSGTTKTIQIDTSGTIKMN
jgi:prepilin-type N-terminal cleavage/methylation domain-containing protein